MHLDKLILIDQSEALCDAWEEVFDGDNRVEVHCGDFFARPADAMLSPANSFGIMDGGLDLAIRDELGFGVEKRVQQVILESYFGELPVGAAIVVPTGQKRWPHLVSAPTMRIPEPVPYSLNAYLAFRAALVAIWRHNQNREDQHTIKSMVVPGLATGIGRMSPRRCAGQMRVAWRQFRGGPRIPSFDMIHKVHRALSKAQ